MAPQLDDKKSILETFRKQKGPDPFWLESLRKEAASQFAGLDFPTLRDEEWKYTNVEPLLKNSFSFAPSTDKLTPPENLLGRDEKVRLVFTNGNFSKELSRIPEENGIIIENFTEALRSHPKTFEPYFAKQADFKKDAFTALNTALFCDGAFIFLPKGEILETPIHLIFISSEEKVISQPRNLIVLGEGAQAKVIETHLSLHQEVYFKNAVTEIVLQPNATLHHYKIQRESKKAFHISTAQITCEKESAYHSYSFTFGAGLSRENINVKLADEGSSCELNGLYLVSDIQHTDHHTMIDHAKPRGRSRQVYKGVLGGRSKAVFNGKIFVRAGAQKTDAHQTNKNILLTRGATVDTKPQLEILADDVKCTHGAAIGELEESEIFYARSRGLSEARARHLLTYGFASEVVSAVKIEPLRSGLDQRVWQALQKEALP